MPIKPVGPFCARRGCERAAWKDALCCRCWRLAKLFEKDPRMFAYEPLGGYVDERDAVELPWERWQAEAEARDADVVSLFAEGAPDSGRGEA